MFSERLENLIKAALQDGVLTDQEKAAIIKRAQEEGEDINEVDIYIQSLLQKRQQELNEEAQKTANAELMAQRKTREARDAAIAEEEKERAKILRKCPACGERIPFGTLACPKCGHVIEQDDKNNEILECIKVIKRAAPTHCCSDNSLAYDHYYNIETFDNDSILQRAYTILGKTKDGKEYETKSNYEELIAQAKVKYLGSPLFNEFLLEERKRCYKMYLKRFEDVLNDAKESAIKGSSYTERRKASAMEVLTYIEIEYGDVADMTMISQKKVEVSSVTMNTSTILRKKNYYIPLVLGILSLIYGFAFIPRGAEQDGPLMTGTVLLCVGGVIALKKALSD